MFLIHQAAFYLWFNKMHVSKPGDLIRPKLNMGVQCLLSVRRPGDPPGNAKNFSMNYPPVRIPKKCQGIVVESLDNQRILLVYFWNTEFWETNSKFLYVWNSHVINS